MSISDLREQLAAVEHTRWADWQRYLHGLCERLPDGSLVIPADLVARWERQIATPYAELSEAEKQSDRDQVDRYWPLIEAMREEIEREMNTIRRIVAAIPEADEPQRVADKVHVALMATTSRTQEALGEVLQLKAQRDEVLENCDQVERLLIALGHETSGKGLIPQIRAIYGEHVEPTPDTPTNEPRYRVGRSVGRTLYDNNILFGLVDTAAQAQQIVDALNAHVAPTNSQVWEQDVRPGPFHNAPYNIATDAAGQPCGCRISEQDEHLTSEHTYCNPGGDPPCGSCHSCLSAQSYYYDRQEADFKRRGWCDRCDGPITFIAKPHNSFWSHDNGPNDHEATPGEAAGHRCPDCDQPTVYQSFSGGREWYCKPCDNQGLYPQGAAPRRLQMLADGRHDQLRQEMRQEIAARRTAPSVVDGQPGAGQET